MGHGRDNYKFCFAYFMVFIDITKINLLTLTVNDIYLKDLYL